MKQVFFDPLEQFDIINVFPILFSYFPTNLNVFIFANLFLIYFVFILILNPVSNASWFRAADRYYLSYNQISLDYRMDWCSFPIFYWSFGKIYTLIFSMIDENILLKKKSFILLIFFLFLFLLVNNLIGMIPYSYTTTSSLILTFFLSTSFFIGINFIGFYHNKSSIFKTFLPGGSPILIAPLLVLIEVISYLSRVFSLSIRLFANMMSGHALLKILIGFSWVAFLGCNFWSIVSILPWLVVSIVLILELAIACLQAYVFTVLICIYINDALNPH